MVNEDKADRWRTGDLWEGDCVLCDQGPIKAGDRQQVVMQARAHREQKQRTGEEGATHKVVVKDSDGNIDGLAIGIQTQFLAHELIEREENCERNGCENDAGMHLTSSAGGDGPTPLDKPSPEVGGSFHPVCEYCVAEYDNIFLRGEGSPSISTFLESEKE